MKDQNNSLDFPTSFAIICSGGTTLELIESIQRHFDELIPVLRSGVFAVRLHL